jgi:hypothetical protein
MVGVPGLLEFQMFWSSGDLSDLAYVESKIGDSEFQDSKNSEIHSVPKMMEILEIIELRNSLSSRSGWTPEVVEQRKSFQNVLSSRMC